METMANMYAFGAMLAYFLSTTALIALRIKEPHTPRPYKVPFNIRFGEVEIPVLGVLGIIGTFAMVVIVLWTHEIARITGPLWVAAWIAYYVWYRQKTGKPVFKSIPRDWDKEQLEILSDTGEWELYERFRIELERRKRHSSVAQ